MTRDISTLANGEFDLLVVGAGIYGATIAWEAAHRGLHVALIDRGDFGGGTSFNSLKTVHGGLRSLQRANLVEMRQFIRERRTLLRIAPHLVTPLRFLIPTYPELRRSRAVMRTVLAVNDWIARDRNEGLDRARHLPASQILGKEETLQLFPGLDASRVTGGASWFDGQMHNADRVLLSFVQSAAAAGATVANYVSAMALVRRGERVEGVSARDELTGATFDVRARVTVNAAGGWAPGLLGTAASRSLAGVRMSRAINLVTRLPAPPCALGDTAGGQFLFCVPWRGRTMFGTLHDEYEGPADALSIAAKEVDRFIELINRAFPAARLRAQDVTLVHRGLLPASGRGPSGEVRLLKDSMVHDHRADGAAGLITVIGVRYTTARHTAQRAIDLAATVLGRSIPASRSSVTPLEGGSIPDVEAFLATASKATATLTSCTLERLARTYGTHYSRVVSMIDGAGSLEIGGADPQLPGGHGDALVM